MNSPERIRSLIQKLHRLASDPAAARGEASAAQERLETLLRKYTLTLEDCCADVRIKREWVCDYEWEKELLCSVCFFILNRERIQTFERKRFLIKTPRSSKRSNWMPGLKGYIIGIELTTEQWIDVSECYDYYHPMLAREMRACGEKMKRLRREASKLPKHALTAFIVQYELMSDVVRESPGKPTPLSPTEIAAIREMMSGMNGPRWKRPAGKVTAGARELEYSAA